MVDATWHEVMRGRSRRFLIAVADRLSARTVELTEELIDANEYGVAVEIMSEELRAHQLTEEEASWLRGLLADMGLGGS